MTNTEQLQLTANQAAAKILQLVENCTNVASNKSANIALNKTSNLHELNVGYGASYSDDLYKVNYPQQITTIGSDNYNDNWSTDNISIDPAWVQLIAKFTSVNKKEDDMLKQMPMELTIERMKKCAKCTYANAVHCMHRFKNNEATTPCPCDLRDMLVYGHCPKFKSTEQVEIELAAEGIDDGKE